MAATAWRVLIECVAAGDGGVCCAYRICRSAGVVLIECVLIECVLTGDGGDGSV